MKGERSMQNEWIVISEYCDKCHIEPTFIDMLCERMEEMQREIHSLRGRLRLHGEY